MVLMMKIHGVKMVKMDRQVVRKQPQELFTPTLISLIFRIN
jgi:hypothetical protein